MEGLEGYRAAASDDEPPTRYPCRTPGCSGHETLQELWACTPNPEEREALTFDDLDPTTEGGH
jgi:hypothetical protein